MSPRARKVTILLLLALGIQLWLLWARGIYGTNQTVLTAVAVFVIALIPPVRRQLWQALARVRSPSPRTRGRAALAIAVGSSAYLTMTAAMQGRSLHPRFHDEFMYLLQARMLSVGRLWMPPLPLGDFFDTFYVFVEPVYASLTWPGGSMMFVPGIWLSLPYWVMPVVVSGAAVGLMYSVFTQLLDGAYGLLAALTLIALPMFRMQSLHSQAQVPIVMLALLLVWAFLRWRGNPTLRNGLLVGAIAGWAAITRPVDALCMALPVGIAMLVAQMRFPVRAKLKTAGAVVAGAAPFLALQLVFNFGVTGKLTKTPFTFYNDRDQPMLQFGFPRYDDTLKLKSRLLQKQLFYQHSVLPAAERHAPTRIPERALDQLLQSLRYNLPNPLLLILFPPALLTLFERQRYVVWSVLPLFVVLYTGYTLFLSHYALFVAPAIIFMTVAGAQAVERNLRAVAPACTLTVAAMCVTMLPEFNRRKPDIPLASSTMDFSMHTLPTLVQAPAVVLFKFHPGLDYHEEPVYNIDTAWPDDAPIIRAHDLGPKSNVALLRYYAERQPNRRFYTVDRRDLSTLRDIGRAGELWALIRASREAAAGAITTAPVTQPGTQPAMGISP